MFCQTCETCVKVTEYRFNEQGNSVEIVAHVQTILLNVQGMHPKDHKNIAPYFTLVLYGTPNRLGFTTTWCTFSRVFILQFMFVDFACILFI